MKFTQLDYDGKLNVIRKYLRRYLEGMKKLQYLESESESLTTLRGVKYSGMPKRTGHGDPVPTLVFKEQQGKKRLAEQQNHILKLEEELNDFFDLLDDTTRLIFEGVFFDGHTYLQIAEAAYISEQTIKRRINKGLEVLLNNEMVEDILTAYYDKHCGHLDV